MPVEYYFSSDLTLDLLYRISSREVCVPLPTLNPLAGA